MWATDATQIATVQDGKVWLFGVAEHWNAELLGWHVRRLGDDPPIVRRLRAHASAMRRQQGMLAHEPQQAFARHPHAIDRTQPGPDLPMAFAGPRRSFEVGADGGKQILVADAGLG